MIFINPKTDFAFKRIFGSEKHKEILISFLNGLLYQGNSVIEDLEILDPYLAPKIRGIKDTYLDIKAKITGQKTVIIEMQVLNLEGFEKRILFNAAKAYSTQLEIGEEYKLLNPVIALTITDFKMFDQFEQTERANREDEVISRFILKEKDYLFDYPIYDLELVFVELPNFSKTLEELATLTDKWLYFLKHAKDLQTVPEIMGSVPAIQQAFEIANHTTLTPEELDDLQKQEFFLYDMRTAVARTAEKFKKEAEKLKKEAERATQEAERATQEAERATQEAERATQEAERATQEAEKNAQNASKQRALEIARQLLDVLDEPMISQKTGLSIEEIQALRE